MHILLEHNGSPENTRAGKIIQEIIENDFGGVCEVMIGNSPNIVLYTEDMKEIVSFEGSYSAEDLEYLVKFIIDEED